MPLDHGRELLEGLQALPLQLRTPAIEELPRRGLALVIPQLPEGLLEQVGGVQALVGREQQLRVLACGAVQILRMPERGVFLAIDERTSLAAHARVLGLAHRVERVAEVAQDVELVEQDRRLRGDAQGRVAEGSAASTYDG